MYFPIGTCRLNLYPCNLLARNCSQSRSSALVCPLRSLFACPRVTLRRLEINTTALHSITLSSLSLAHKGEDRRGLTQPHNYSHTFRLTKNCCAIANNVLTAQ